MPTRHTLPWPLLLGLAAGLAAAPAAQAQRAASALLPPPHLGYLYPAGAQQGTTVQATVGGQFLHDVKGVHVGGEGLQVTLGKYTKPMNAEEFFRMQEKFKEVQKRMRAEMASSGMGSAPATYHKILKELGLTEDDLKALRQFAERATNPKRQINFQIAETVALQIKVASGTPLGEREVRLITASGLSNPLVFHVGQLPECRKNASAGAASETEVHETLPVVLNGQILPGGVDRFSFTGRKGARLVAAACARELVPYLADAVPGWFQATLALYDAKGNELAYAEDYRFRPDPVLSCELPADGRYVLEIQDAIYRGREDFVYRITLGELPFVTGIYPLGSRSGAPAAVALQGWNLPTDKLTVNPSDKGPGVHPISVRKDQHLSNRVPFVRDTLPECQEQEPNDLPASAQRVTLPIAVNGRIDRPGDWDVFRFEGRAHSEIVAEVFARRLGSPLDSLLKLTDASGRLLAANDDYEDKGAALITHQADSRLAATLPASGTYYLHVGDTQHNGGSEYAYRLRIGPPRPDFELRMVPSGINARAGTTVPITVYALRRDGFDGEIVLELKNAPRGFALNAGVLPAHQEKVRLTVLVGQTGTEKPLNLSLQGRATIHGRETTRPALPADDMLQAFAYHHLVPAKECLVMVAERHWANLWWKLLNDQPVKLSAGGTAQVRFAVPSALAEQAQLALSEPPEGITIQSVTPIREGVAIVLRADAKKVNRAQRGNLIVDATMERSAEPQQKKPSQGDKRRIPIGSLPAIPFEIVGS